MKDLYKALKMPRLPGAYNVEKQEKPYTGSGKRTGTPGHYKYDYSEHEAAGKHAVSELGTKVERKPLFRDVTEHTHASPLVAAEGLVAHLKSKGAVHVKEPLENADAIEALYNSGHSVVSVHGEGPEGPSDNFSRVMVHAPGGKIFQHDIRSSR